MQEIENLFLAQYINRDVKYPAFLVLSLETRYELAQQLQPQPTEDPLGAGTVAHEMQVEIEGDSLQQQPVTSAEQQSMLGLGQTEVVNGGQQVTLEAPLTDQPLVQGEGKNSLCECYQLHMYKPWNKM